MLLFLNGNASPALARAVLASADADAEDVAAALAAAQAEAPAGSAAHAVGPWEVPEGAGPVLLTGYHERLRGQDLILGAVGTPAEAFALWLAAHEASGERAHRINVDVVAWLPSAAELRAWLDATAAVARAEVVGRRRHALERSRWLGRAARNNDDRALVAAALNLAGAPETERAEAAAALDAKLAPYAATVAGLRAAAGGAPPPPDAAQAARAARAAAAALEDDEKLGDVARAMSWLIDQGAVPTRLWAADLGAPAADPARGLAVVRLRAVALLAPALAEAPLPLPLRQARRS